MYSIHELNLIAEALSEEPEMLDELSNELMKRYVEKGEKSIRDLDAHGEKVQRRHRGAMGKRMAQKVWDKSQKRINKVDDARYKLGIGP